jgi:hypothetical protein
MVATKKPTTDSTIQYIVKKIHSDEYMNERKGANFGKSYFGKIILSGNVDCMWEDEDKNLRLLFKVRRKVIPEDIAKDAFNTFVKHSMKLNDQRAVAAGTDKKIWDKNGISRSTSTVRSNISGYFDKPYMQIKKHFNTTTVCRTTAFTTKNWDKWEKSLPFFQKIADCYKELAPVEYRKQISLFKTCPSGFRIGKTPFTTVTSNYNWRTSCHRDKGDFKDGMGNLTVLGGDFKGGYLGFPQFGVAVDVKSRDVAIMDVHQWHCNTELYTNDKDKVRLSFVTYFREKMVQCNKKKVVDGVVYYFKG